MWGEMGEGGVSKIQALFVLMARVQLWNCIFRTYSLGACAIIGIHRLLLERMILL